MKTKRKAGRASGRDERIDITTVETPLGRFAVAATRRGLVAIVPFARRGKITGAWTLREPALARRIRAGAKVAVHEGRGTLPPGLRRASGVLRSYASGRTGARVPTMDAAGTPFQRAVWKRLCAIPAGRTITYGELAASIGRPKAARAVGAAVGANPISILVPCHRVIGSDGSLTGFAYGLDMKRALLRHEQRGAK